MKRLWLLTAFTNLLQYANQNKNNNLAIYANEQVRRWSEAIFSGDQ